MFITGLCIGSVTTRQVTKAFTRSVFMYRYNISSGSLFKYCAALIVLMFGNIYSVILFSIAKMVFLT